MLVSEWKIEEKECCIDVPWGKKEYYINHKYICKNCRKYSPGSSLYLFCPHCGASMINGKEEVEFSGAN